jgi:glycosyltransferase involved in cell wall biosynthesis
MTEAVEEKARTAVIVPTRDRPQSLARCLDALDRQTGLSELDVIVVDDGSADAAAVADAVSKTQRGRLLRHDGTHTPSAARNRGAKETAAPMVLFTDDDCEPAPDWAARMTAALDAGAAVVAGMTTNGSPGDPIASASETILAYVQDRARSDGSTTFAATYNLGCRRRVIAEFPFDEAYRHGEDRDWCARVRAAGYVVQVEPAALVAHRQQLGLASFLVQQFGYGRGAYLYRRRHCGLGKLEAPSFYAGLLERGFSHGVTAGVLVGVAQAATAAGFAREALSRRP